MTETRLPAKRALAVLDTAAPAEPIPLHRISKKVRSGIEFMVMGDCKIIKDAAEKAGLTREHFTRELSKPHVAAYMREKVLKQLAIAASELSKPHVAAYMREKVLKQLAIAAARAGAVKGELLDSDNDMVRDRASTFVLGLADIAPATAPALSVNLELRAGYILDLRDDLPAPPMRVVSTTDSQIP